MTTSSHNVYDFYTTQELAKVDALAIHLTPTLEESQAQALNTAYVEKKIQAHIKMIEDAIQQWADNVTAEVNYDRAMALVG